MIYQQDTQWALGRALDGAEQRGYETGRAGRPRCSPFVTPVFDRRYDIGYDRGKKEGLRITGGPGLG